MTKVNVKKFILVPSDALEVLERRFADLPEATESAAQACSDNGQTVYVVELRAIAARADRPVKVTKL